MKILLVAFGPYADHPVNPAEKAASLLHRDNVKTIVLPASWAKTMELTRIIAEEKPDAIITANVTPYRHEPTLEQYAYNEMNSVQADIDGIVHSGDPIIPGGPVSLYSKVDLPSVQSYVDSQGNSVALSIDPGRFICNQAAYLCRASEIPTISVHIPLERDFPMSEDVELLENLVDYLEATIF